MRKTFLTTVALLTFTAAHAEDLTVGRLVINGEYAPQVIAVENHTNQTYSEVECGFYNSINELVGSGFHWFDNVQGTAHGDVISDHASDAKYIRCRIDKTK